MDGTLPYAPRPEHLRDTRAIGEANSFMHCFSQTAQQWEELLVGFAKGGKTFFFGIVLCSCLSF